MKKHSALFMIVFALMLFTAPRAYAQEGAEPPPVPVLVQTHNALNFQILDNLEAALVSLNSNDPAVPSFLDRIGELRNKMYSQNNLVESFKGKLLTESETGQIEKNNAEVQETANEINALKREVYQFIDADILNQMVKSGKYGILPNGDSQCNVFLNDYAAKIFGYRGFTDPKTGNPYLANEIARRAQTGLLPFKAVEGKNLQDRMREAQNLVNKGIFVFISIYNPNGHGHVAVILSGDLVPTQSGKWGTMDMVRVAQAGKTVDKENSTPAKKVYKENVFSGKTINYAFGPEDKDKIQFFMYSPPPQE